VSGLSCPSAKEEAELVQAVQSIADEFHVIVGLAVGVSQLEADIPLFDGLGMLVSWHTIIRVRARESEIEREHQ
jgi:hypothetical protein